MKKTLPFAEALELVKDNPELTATINDLIVDGADTVTVEFDDEGIQILNITKDAPTVDSSHVPTTEWNKKDRVLPFESVTKAFDEEERYTLSPWYVPDSLDAHGEWTDTKEVQHAFWKYLAQDNRDIRLQHNLDIVAGEWVEGCTFPWELTVPVKHPEGDTEYTFPAGTPFLGIIWQPWAWELIKKGDIRGLSIGGTANRHDMDVEKDDSDPTGSVTFTKMIHELNGKFELFSHDGKRHLGSFKTEEEAKARESEINRIKHIKKAFVIPSGFIDNMNLMKHASFFPEPTKEGLAAELCDLLGDVVAFRFIAQGFHWNVTGINFQQFHELFQEIYEDADSSIDPIAENIRKLNFDAPFRLSDFMCNIGKMTIPETNDPLVMSQVLYIANEQLRGCLVKGFQLANAINEQGIANFLAERLDMHGKWQWQLRTIVGDNLADAYEIDVAEYGSMLSENIDTHMHAEPEMVTVAVESEA
jgi:starvation-inducible DNA-binding protein